MGSFDDWSSHQNWFAGVISSYVEAKYMYIHLTVDQNDLHKQLLTRCFMHLGIV